MTSLPGGTVTFVFTDIEGSTRLLQELGDDYAGVARDHRRLVRDAFVARGGNEIDTQGDSFFFSFPRARDAVSAAVDAQRSLRDPAGEQHLKDIQHEHIYEISVDGAPVGARPLKTTAPDTLESRLEQQINAYVERQIGRALGDSGDGGRGRGRGDDRSTTKLATGGVAVLVMLALAVAVAVVLIILLVTLVF